MLLTSSFGFSSRNDSRPKILGNSDLGTVDNSLTNQLQLEISPNIGMAGIFDLKNIRASQTSSARPASVRASH
jgi:hypothetical protein